MSCFGFVPFWLLLFLLMRLQTVFRCFPPEFILSRRGLPIVPPSVSSILLPHSFLSRNPPCARFFLGTRPHSLHQETLPIPPEGRLPAGMCHLPTTNRPTLIISHVDPPAIRMRPQSSCFLPSAFWHSSDLWGRSSVPESTNVRRGVGSEALVGCPILAPPFGESPFSFLPPPIRSNSFPLFSFLATHRLPFAGIRPHPFFPIRPPFPFHLLHWGYPRSHFCSSKP